MNGLDKHLASKIINELGAYGQPPDYGHNFFSAGLDPYLNIINEEYLASFIKDGGGAFKMVIGIHGGGKTHFLYSIRDLAWKNNFIVSYVSLKSTECPFNKLELVYKAIVKGLIPPLSVDELLTGYERGMPSFLRGWFGKAYRKSQENGLSGDELNNEVLFELSDIDNIESISFSKAVKNAFNALLDHKDEDFSYICQWLNGEKYERRIHGRYGIFQQIDKTTAFIMIRSLVQWIKQIGYSGLVILFDEAEQVPSLSTKEKNQHLSNLREIIDECGHTAFQNIMIFYSIPDVSFLESGRMGIYEALNQRISSVFEDFNPRGVKILLEKTIKEPIDFLIEVGHKIKSIYETAHDYNFNESNCKTIIDMVADDSHKKHFMDDGYKRIFVKSLIKCFDFLRIRNQMPAISDIR